MPPIKGPKTEQTKRKKKKSSKTSSEITSSDGGVKGLFEILHEEIQIYDEEIKIHKEKDKPPKKKKKVKKQRPPKPKPYEIAPRDLVNYIKCFGTLLFLVSASEIGVGVDLFNNNILDRGMRRGAWWAGVLGVITGSNSMVVGSMPPDRHNEQRKCAVVLTYFAGISFAVSGIGCLDDCPDIPVLHMQDKCQASCGLLGSMMVCSAICFLSSGYFQNLPIVTDGQIINQTTLLRKQLQSERKANARAAAADFKLAMLNGGEDLKPGKKKQQKPASKKAKKASGPKKIQPVE